MTHMVSDMVKTRLETVDEVLAHLTLLIAETERSIEHARGHRRGELLAELNVLKCLRDMITC